MTRKCHVRFVGRERAVKSLATRFSLLEAKESIDPEIVEQVANVLKVPPEAIRNFSEETAINIISNTFNNHDHSTPQVANTTYGSPNFSPIDKIVELYERMLSEKDALIAKLSGEREDKEK